MQCNECNATWISTAWSVPVPSHLLLPFLFSTFFQSRSIPIAVALASCNSDMALFYNTLFHSLSPFLFPSYSTLPSNLKTKQPNSSSLFSNTHSSTNTYNECLQVSPDANRRCSLRLPTNTAYCSPSTTARTIFL